MRTSSGTSSLPIAIAMATASVPAGSGTSPKADTDASFHDVLQQHGGDTSPKSTGSTSKTPVPTVKTGTTQTPQTATVSAKSQTSDPTTTLSETTPCDDTPLASDDPTKIIKETTPPADAQTKSKFTPLPSGTALSAMIVQAAAQISTARSSSIAKGPVSTNKPDASAATDPGKDSAADTTPAPSPLQAISSGLDLSTLVAQITMLTSTGPKVPMTATASDSKAASTTDSGTSFVMNITPTQNPVSFTSGSPDLSTLPAQATILASNAAQISTATIASNSNATATMILGKEAPSSGLNPAATTTATKEKKSAGTNAEGTFIQFGTTSSSAVSNFFNMLSPALTGTAQSPVDQKLTANADTTNLALTSLSGSGVGTAGTANVEKGKEMNATLNLPEIFSGYGTNVVPQHTPVDMHIQLSTNNDFEDALKQVMHVAQLTQTSESRTPMRVEIEIQTPPGAIVNVYVSRQNDQWRAQLSTNDPQALGWVQDKMSSLRQSSDLGVEVRWLPPQMESTPAGTGGNQSNLGWDRGSQNQQNYQQQQQDERQQASRQKRAELFAGIGTGQFMEALTSIGSAA